MDRRDFFKIVSTVSAGLATDACGKKSDVLIPLLVPNQEIVPGEEQWHPAVCTGCGAGCGVIARVMEGERIVERNGQKFRERIAAIKKLEGNPLDPVSGGRLCARGQAALQSLYNPDRLTGPMKRSGERGSATFAAISWDEAIASVAEKIAAAKNKVLFLTSSQAGTRSTNIQHFLQAIGAPPAISWSLTNLATERQAAAAVFGWKGIPRYDLANARYVLGVGADFLGGWASPVYYGRQFGHFRQGRPGIRGKLVQAESRMSITAQSADEWLPVLPGREISFLHALARILLDEKLARNTGQLAPGFEKVVRSANITELAKECGIPEERIRRIARELGESEAPLVIGGASIGRINSLGAVFDTHYLNWMLGNIGRPGGMLPPYEPATQTLEPVTNTGFSTKEVRVLILDDGVNPFYTLPYVFRDPKQFDAIISLGMFADDSAAYADFILPTHHPLESEIAVVPDIAVKPVSVNVARPFVQPLHNTRPLEQILDGIAGKMNAAFTPVNAAAFTQPLLALDRTWDDVTREGGAWYDKEIESANLKPLAKDPGPQQVVILGVGLQPNPLHFQVYPSLQYADGRDANLPWMQELPDPVSSAMWDLPVEIDPKTAASLNITTGDRVRLQSMHGSIEATAYVDPAAIPGVLSMAMGQGHAHYGRYASNRGANPNRLLDFFGDTEVNIERLNQTSELTQFSPKDREQGPWGRR